MTITPYGHNLFSGCYIEELDWLFGLSRKERDAWDKYIKRSTSKLTSEPKWWPVDRLQKTFLPRSCRKIGQQKYGDEWINLNFDALKALASLFDELSNGEVWEDIQDRPNMPSLYQLQCTNAAINPTAKLPRYPDDFDFEDIKSSIATLFLALQSHLAKYDKVEQSLSESLCDGFITSYGRAKPGGQYQILDSAFWLVDDQRALFRDGELPWHPGFEEEVFIFIESFEVLIANNKTKPVNLSERSKSDEYTSPYVLMMKAMTKEFGISVTNQPQKQQLQSWIHKNWERFLPKKPSDKMLGYIATLTREPDSQAGARSPLARPRKKS
jgi:hypothetical protein